MSVLVLLDVEQLSTSLSVLSNDGMKVNGENTTVNVVLLGHVPHILLNLIHTKVSSISVLSN
jgi:hypothetical protein